MMNYCQTSYSYNSYIIRYSAVKIMINIILLQTYPTITSSGYFQLFPFFTSPGGGAVHQCLAWRYTAPWTWWT